MLFICKTYDNPVFKKFLKDDKGLYYNDRMRLEVEKRKFFCESRRKNIGHRYNKSTSVSTYVDNKKLHMEDVNVIEDKDVIDIKKKKYGEYKHVLLTDAEYERLRTEWGQTKLDAQIKNLDEGIQMKGYKYKDHNLTIRKWAEKDPKPGQGGGGAGYDPDRNQKLLAAIEKEMKR